MDLFAHYLAKVLDDDLAITLVLIQSISMDVMLPQAIFFPSFLRISMSGYTFGDL